MAFFEEYRQQIYLGLAGLILMGIGVLTIFGFQQKEPTIEIISSQDEAKSGSIFIDLQGAVEKPGVYEMPTNSRLNDLLILAGGLSSGADREWIETNLNLAQKLVDGAKIYIPERSETLRSLDEGGQAKIVSNKINLNKASTSELDSLWGIGEKRAADIIKNRPYQTVEDLIKRKIIPQNVYEKIKDEVVAY